MEGGDERTNKRKTVFINCIFKFTDTRIITDISFQTVGLIAGNSCLLVSKQVREQDQEKEQDQERDHRQEKDWEQE